MKRLGRHFFLSGLIWLPPSLLYADDLVLTPTLYFFNYQEFNQNNQLLDKEQGAIPGLRLSFNPVQRAENLRAHVSLYGGRVDYTGQTQLGVPHETETIEQLINFGVTLDPGYQSAFLDNIFFGFQYWNWDRDILTRNNVLGLHENYSWFELELGLSLESRDNPSSSYWLSLSAFRTLGPKMKLKLPSSSVTLDLGSKPGFRLRAGKKWGNSRGWLSSVNLLVEYWEFGRSNSVFTDDFFGQSGFVTEPRSETRHSALEFMIRYGF
ncbi:MAG: hypothetical protein ACC663_03635 [Gammaproteobacteria bacterium]